MALAASQGMLHTQEFVYDFAVHGGTAGAIAIDGPNGAQLPLGAVIFDVLGVTETALAGATATIALGTSAAAASFMAAHAVALFDTAGKVVGQAVIPTTCVRADGSTTRDVKVTIATANLTAGKIRYIFRYYIPSTHVQTN